jgi:hypothetical protein
MYVEVLGNGGLYSVNYERRVSETWGLRAGVATWFNDGTYIDTRMLTVPLMVSRLVGSGKGRLELAGGLLTGARFSEQDTQMWNSEILSLTGTVGYRFQPRSRGMLLRAGITPFYSLNDRDDAYPDTGFLVTLGVSAGYTF